jgi:hypothetical protein
MRALPTLLVVIAALALGTVSARADVAPAHASAAAARVAGR